LLEKKLDEQEESRRPESGRYVTGEFKVAGVIRLLTKEDRKNRDPFSSWEFQQGEVFLPAASGEALFRQLPWLKDQGFYAAEVRVRPGSDLAGTVAAIEAMGYDTSSGLKWFNSAKREVTLIAAGLNLFALIALFVAGIGITN